MSLLVSVAVSVPSRLSNGVCSVTMITLNLRQTLTPVCRKFANILKCSWMSSFLSARIISEHLRAWHSIRSCLPPGLLDLLSDTTARMVRGLARVRITSRHLPHAAYFGVPGDHAAAPPLSLLPPRFHAPNKGKNSHVESGSGEPDCTNQW